ncbi:unnamed protein product [Adineta ricciae]|uniref:Uncharacterized protein n=1 Tax=Adineta ricciae TaxID=249248 RepID=A0A815F1K5_ADIRI|nr:unnamed protein product [Adineta ricciae]CAF1614203.1 unnamed protein product [Adineta ricciae]
MNGEKSTTAAHTSTSRPNPWDPLEYCRKHNFSVQSTPPLSIRQYVRSTIRNNHGNGPWKPTGVYHANINIDDRNSSKVLPDLKPEPRTVVNKGTPWRPSGHRIFKPVPYFDCPSLRWSMEDVKRSMPEFQTTSTKSS